MRKKEENKISYVHFADQLQFVLTASQVRTKEGNDHVK